MLQKRHGDQMFTGANFRRIAACVFVWGMTLAWCVIVGLLAVWLVVGLVGE